MKWRRYICKLNNSPPDLFQLTPPQHFHLLSNPPTSPPKLLSPSHLCYRVASLWRPSPTIFKPFWASPVLTAACATMNRPPRPFLTEEQMLAMSDEERAVAIAEWSSEHQIPLYAGYPLTTRYRLQCAPPTRTRATSSTRSLSRRPRQRARPGILVILIISTLFKSTLWSRTVFDPLHDIPHTRQSWQAFLCPRKPEWHCQQWC